MTAVALDRTAGEASPPNAISEPSHPIRTQASGPLTVRIQYLDPTLQPEGVSENRFTAALELAGRRYRNEWGTLPVVRLDPERAISSTSSPADIAQLRERLGLDAAPRWEKDLADKLEFFQQVHGLKQTGRADRATIEALNRGPEWYLQTIERNIQRARQLPHDLGDKFVLVDLAGQELRAYDHGSRELDMRVIQGRPSMQTPLLADRIETIVANPYWNLPPDIVRKSIAPAVLSEEVSWLEEHDYEVLSDWSADPKPVDSADVDWQAVADGSKLLRVRERPGPDNAMGSVKFMFPNPLGIYLHDTPHKDLFEYADRRLSHGCVRVEDPEALAEFLVEDEAGFLSSDRPNHRVRLGDPVPVYTGYFTAWPEKGGLTFQEDVYEMDGAMNLADMSRTAQGHRTDGPSRTNG